MYNLTSFLKIYILHKYLKTYRILSREILQNNLNLRFFRTLKIYLKIHIKKITRIQSQKYKSQILKY